MTTGRPSISTPRTRTRTWLARSLTVLWTISWVMCGTRLSLATERRDKVQPSRQAPLWQLDVAALGFAVPKLLYEHAGAWGPGHVCFPTRDTMVVTSLRERCPQACLSGARRRRCCRFVHALFIDAKDGKLRARREWPAVRRGRRSQRVPTGSLWSSHLTS